MARGLPGRDIRRMHASRGPNIRIPPPAIYTVAFLLGLFFDTLVPIRQADPSAFPTTLNVVGMAFMLVGAVVMFSGMVTFRRAGTTILPFRPATAFVQDGPYRFTRNPMYFGMTVVYIGASLAMHAGWPLLLLPVALYAMGRFVIRAEEEYLESLFGEDYRTYKKRVRRWV